jgi:hypothetical protein
LWSRGAENELTQLWIDHPDLRHEITSKSHSIESQLGDDAERFADESRIEERDLTDHGDESVSFLLALGFDLPLAVEFVIEHAIVVVIRVRLVKPPEESAGLRG